MMCMQRARKRGGSLWGNFFLNIELIDENAKMPTRASDGDAGMDVYSPDEYVIPPRGDVLIPLGWRYEMPIGYALVFAEKSGVATKLKLDLGAKICDALYRGIVHVHLFNNSDETVVITPGQKIAQFLILPVWYGQAEQVNSISTDTTRGEGGFGSSGTH